MEKQSVDFHSVCGSTRTCQPIRHEWFTAERGSECVRSQQLVSCLESGLSLSHHFGHYVWRRGPRKPRGDRGALHLQKGAEGDHLLHSGVWDGYHGLAGHLFHQSGGHRHIYSGQVARRSAPVPFLLLLHAVLRFGWHVYSVRNVSGEISGHKPRVLLLAACGPGYGSVCADGDVPGQYRAVHLAQFWFRKAHETLSRNLVLLGLARHGLRQRVVHVSLRRFHAAVDRRYRPV